MKNLVRVINPIVLAVTLLPVGNNVTNAAGETENKITPAAGGTVSRTSKVEGVGSIEYPIQFKNYLTSSWAKASSYTVSRTVTQSSSHTGSITYEGIEELKAQYQYGKITSTADMIGTVIPANSKNYSKLALKIKYKEQNFKEYVTETFFYDGDFKTKKYSNSGRYKIPVDKYIYVVYK